MCPTTHYLTNPLQRLGVRVKSVIADEILPNQLISLVQECCAQVIICSSIEPAGEKFGGTSSAWTAIRQARMAFSKIPFVAIWWDTCWPGFQEILKISHGMFDLHIPVDNPVLEGLTAGISQSTSASLCNVRYYPLNYELGLFRPSMRCKYDVIFVGQISGKRSYRAKYIDIIRSLGLKVYISTESRSSQTSLQSYSAEMSKSLVCVNFSYSVSSHQLKGRVWEAVQSGCMLLEEAGSPVRMLFSEQIDFDAFSNPLDLANKLIYYCKTKKGRTRARIIGRNAYKKAISQYNAYMVLEDMLGFILSLRK